MRLVTSKDSLAAPLPVGTAIAAVEFPVQEREVTAPAKTEVTPSGPPEQLLTAAAGTEGCLRLTFSLEESRKLT